MKAKALLLALGLGLAGTAAGGDWRGGVWVYQPSDGYRPPSVHRYDPRSPYSHYPRYRQNLPQDNRAYVPNRRYEHYPKRLRPGEWAQSRPDRYQRDDRFDRPGRHDPNDRWRGDNWRQHDWRRDPPRVHDSYRGYPQPRNQIYFRSHRD